MRFQAVSLKFVFLILLLGMSALSAQESPEKPSVNALSAPVVLSDALEEIRRQYKLPSLAGAIVTREGITEIAAVGLRKVVTKAPVTENDLWHLGSCTKAMTATLIGILVNEGKLTWETTIAEVFPMEAEAMDAGFRKITLMHLLTHRSGLPANGPWRALGDNLSPLEQRHELLRRMMIKPLKHAAGSQFLYSNVGYSLAGFIAETVTETPWEQLIQEKLFEPLEMKDVGFGVPGTMDKVDQPWGHYKSWLGFGPLEPVQLDNASSLGPAGTVHASLRDWAKFIALHITRDNTIVPESIWMRLHTPPEGADYALGWGVQKREWAGGESLTHSGSNTVNYCVCWLAPEKGFAVIVASNTGQPDAALTLDRAASLLIKRHLAK